MTTQNGASLAAPEADFSSATTPAMSTTPTMEKLSDAEKVLPSSSDNEAGSTEEETYTRTLRGWKWALVCFAIYSLMFIYGLDSTVAADVQGPVVEAFGHIEQLAWIGTGFPLGSIAVMLLMGRLCSEFNIKWIFISSIVLFEVGSAICGAAPSMDALIVGRVLAGIGGSGLYLGGINYMTVLTEPKERALYINGTGLWWMIGAVLGPIVGGAFSESSATWRWAFYINLVIGAVAAPIYFLYLPSIYPDTNLTVLQRLAQFDGLGFFLIAATWTLFTFSFTVAGGQWAWSDGRSIAVLAVFGVLFLAAIVQQYFSFLTVPERRAFPVHLLRRRTQVLAYVGTSCATSSLFVNLYFIPIYFQFVHSDSAIQAAVRLLPFVACTAAVSISSGYLLSRIRRYMPMYLVSGILVSLGGGLLVGYLDPATSERTIYGLTIVAGLGTGITIQLGYSVASLTVGAADARNSVNMQNVAQIGSNVICLVIAGQVFQSYAVAGLTDVLAGHGFTTTQISQAVAGARSELIRELDPELKAMAIGAIVKAMQRAFSLTAAAGGGLLITAACMKREKLFGEVVTGA